MNALIRVPLCPLFAAPGSLERVDEALLGCPVQVLERRGALCRIKTHYQYTGWVAAREVLCADLALWYSRARCFVTAPACDLLESPAFSSPILATLYRGGTAALCPGPKEPGWARVTLPSGQEGWLPAGHLRPLQDGPAGSEAELRRAVCADALSYLGTNYRWGGKSPLGIDCSGLASMAYLLNGVVIFRDSRMDERFPIHPIPAPRRRPGDLLYFPGHVAVYLGEERYVHSTARGGGVVVNSLDPAAPDYRADLAERLTAVGSLF